jgi:hypothetical protein
MPAKTESATVPRFVRWTDDEWTRIASYLSLTKGAVQFASSNLAEVKAKDVFVAQQVLPAERHRKLVSIAQGFDGIRTRLGVILQSLPKACQDDVFQPKHLTYRDEEVKKGKTSDVRGTVTGKAGQLLAIEHMNNVKLSPHLEPQAAYAGSAAATVTPPGLHRTARLNSGIGKPPPGQTRRANGTLEDEEECSRQAGQLSSNQPALFQSASTLMELTRPFIEMVCDEFVQAFFSVLSKQEARHALQTDTIEAPGKRAARTQATFDERQNTVGRPSPERDNTAQSQGCIADNLLRPASFFGVLDDNDIDGEEVEVQPLFDPKLPPSADSDFKPNIGMVATQANDLQELRQLYPQLNLTMVQADSVSDVRCFGHCQRIIALHDELAPATDELLGRLLRHRYVRLGGGIAAIKAQLNAWLHVGGSISSPPKRSMPPYGREPVGEIVKKGQNRYPRIIGR